MNEVESFEHAGLTVRLFYDDSGLGDPRDADNLAHFYCWHPDYQLGDEQFSDEDGRGAGPRKDGRRVPLPVHTSIQDAYRHCRAQGATVILPLFLYDHSGISISAGASIERLTRADVETRGRNPFDAAGWDMSWVGFAYATEERRKLLGVSRSRAEVERQVRAEVQEYDQYLRGEVYGYVVTGAYGETLDDMCGLLGLDYALEEGRQAAEDSARRLQARALNRNPVPA
jgi:hypothetical protein